MMSLVESISLRLSEMTPMRPADRDAFGNYLTLLRRARINEGHGDLIDAVQKTALELNMTTHEEYMPTIRHLRDEMRRARPRRASIS